MPNHLHRYTFYTLLYLWSGFAMAEETSDPFNTKAMLPLKPALHLDGAVGDPC
jgi:hypothetical protein